MSEAGALEFARYAYPPNALGYCGPADHQALLEHAAAGIAGGGLVQLARGFDGAWPYLELIAAANRIRDPLDLEVVQAYWLGNRLLDRVEGASFGAALDERFRARSGRRFGWLAEAVPAGALPHHSFHVLGVYPWVGLLRAGTVEQPLRVLDRCRVRWGRVLAAQGPMVVVRYRPLRWEGGALGLGPPAVEQAVGSAGGLALAGPLRVGDWVSLHWDWVCGRLTPRQLGALRRSTLRQLQVVNGTTHPAPAAVLA
ncbi:MAG TPA: DUF6390 family protein [Actinomycetota bacterium]|nr:DUF6390 family protein [Actinomycetota bacterium]